MTNQLNARAAGLTGMAGSVLFTYHFIAINPLLNRFGSPFSRRSVAAIKRLFLGKGKGPLPLLLAVLKMLWLLPGLLIWSSAQDFKVPGPGNSPHAPGADLKSH
jgi:hypothetical protein